LILDLLDLTRIESGERRRDIAEIDLVEVAQVAIETQQSEADRRGIAVTLDAPDPVRLSADRSEMEIVLNNLISNAVKYNRDGGQVTVTLRHGDGIVTVRVRDTGIGMAPEERRKLFQEFARIRNEKTRTIPGSGLGLSTVRKLAHLYKGEVAVESAPDEGSTFTVTLDASGESASDQGSAAR
jgi:two-component system, sensor histidine kinase and response regulator